ncbi:MAG TPA: methyltransferase domain-containing protein [Gemmatimonadaceae bacterium]|jgi:SAM-dependent methyltransferase|nr:methyltransferase domain-containing protein [Gemmatimonadaceae bacterium]
MLSRLRRALASAVPAPLRRFVRPSGIADLATQPVSTQWGFDRGTPVDRWYIERFLAEHAGDIRGRALEIRNADYVERFGTGVVRADVLDIDANNPRATIVADLTAADHVPDGLFDCFVLTQTLQFIYDVPAALRHAHRLLAPDGVLLATLPVVSRIAPRYGLDVDYWRFTAAGCRRLFGDAFGADQVDVRTKGNVLACMAFLEGAALEELPPAKLEADDPYHPLIVTIRAVKR